MFNKFIILLFLVHSSCFAWTYVSATRDTFPTNTVTVNVSSNACPNAGLSTTAEVMNAAIESVDKFWNKVATSALVIKRGAVLAFNSDGATSLTTLLNNTSANTILVGCNDDHSAFGGTSGTLGIGGISCLSSSDCRGALLLNDRAASNPIANGTRAQLLSTIAHEIGHALGLGHTSDKIALMYYAEDGRVQNYLTNDDIAGISALYPHDEELAGLLGSCGIIQDIDKDNQDGPSNFIINFLFGLFLVLMMNLLKKLLSSLQRQQLY